MVGCEKSPPACEVVVVPKRLLPWLPGWLVSPKAPAGLKAVLPKADCCCCWGCPKVVPPPNVEVATNDQNNRSIFKT